VPAECLAVHGIGSNADLEVKHPGLVKESKIAVTSHRSHRVFGLHGNDMYNLDPDIDKKLMRGN
jgi:hypothetical protein